MVAAAGGAPRRLTTMGRTVMGVPQWSPDGKSIYVLSSSSEGAGLFRVPVAGGRPQRLETSTVARPWAAALSPDGRWYGYSAIERGWAFVEIVPTAGGARRRIATRNDRVWNTRGVWARDGSAIRSRSGSSMTTARRT